MIHVQPTEEYLQRLADVQKEKNLHYDEPCFNCREYLVCIGLKPEQTTEKCFLSASEELIANRQWAYIKAAQQMHIGESDGNNV